MAKLKDLKIGEWFTLKPIECPKETQVFIRNGYDRTEQKYWCQRFSDIGDGRYLSGNREVYTDFIF